MPPTPGIETLSCETRDNRRDKRLTVPVCDCHLQRVQYRERARTVLVEDLARAVLHYPEVDVRIALRYAHALAEESYGRGGHSPPPYSRKRGHARVVPTGDVRVLDELYELPLGQDSVPDINRSPIHMRKWTQ